MGANFHEYFLLSPISFLAMTPASRQVYDSTNARLNDATKKLAFGFYPATTSPITHIAFYADITGTMTDITLIAQIETSSSGAPSGTPTGTATAAFAAPTSDGWTSAQALGTQTGTLTLNTLYWLVIADGGGTPPTSSNYTRITYGFPSGGAQSGLCRYYNSSDWTTVSHTIGTGAFYAVHADGTYTGYPIAGIDGLSAHTEIYGTNRQGIFGQFSQAQTISGAIIKIGKTASPSNLEASFYAADVLQQTVTLTAADILGGNYLMPIFTPVVIPGGTRVNVILHQASDGGDASNCYETFVHNAATMSGLRPANWGFCYGTSTTPSSLTTSTTEIPIAAFVNSDGPEGATGAGIIPGFNSGFN